MTTEEEQAEAYVARQIAEGSRAGSSWAAEQPAPRILSEIIEESDLRYPATHPDFIRMHNLSGGFIEGAQGYFRAHPIGYLPHIQTHTDASDERGKVGGNCAQTAIAAVVGWEIEAVPHVMLFGRAWGSALEVWAEQAGFLLDVYTTEQDAIWWAQFLPEGRLHMLEEAPDDVVLIASGQSPRGDWQHSVLWRAGALLHDVHPDGTGIVGDPIEYWRLTPAPPAAD